MKKIFLAILLICSLSAIAQTVPIISINGLKTHEIYTKAQVIAALGVPTKYRFSDDELGGVHLFEYEHNGKYDSFRFQYDTGFVYFSLKTTRFSINNKIKIGDRLTALNQIPGKLMFHGGNSYRYTPTHWDDAIKIETNDAKEMKSIWFSASN